MRVGVIRGDLAGPLHIMDLEPVSQYNPVIEPRGQDRLLSRPTVASVAAALLRIGAGAKGTADLTNGATINGTNNVLRLRTENGGNPYTITIAPGAYASGGALVIALNNAIRAVGAGVLARLSADGKNLVLSAKRTGPTSYLDIAASGSTSLAVLGLTAGGGAFVPPAPAAVITATSPVNGPIDVSPATLRGLVGQGATDEQVALLADAIAPFFAETDAVLQSYLVGHIAGFRAANFNPDRSRRPAFANGPAVAVLKDDGVTAYTLPGVNITAAVHDSPATGDLTITGTLLGTPERKDTIVRVTNAAGNKFVRLEQHLFTLPIPGQTQGKVSATSIVIPRVLLSGLGVAGSKVQVQFTSFVSNKFTVT